MTLELLSRNGLVSEAEGLHDGVMYGGTQLADLLVGSCGVHAIGEQDDEKIALGIDPNRSAGESGMADRLRRAG